MGQLVNQLSDQTVDPKETASGLEQVETTNTSSSLSRANCACAWRAVDSSRNNPNTVEPLPESSASSAPCACKVCLISRSGPCLPNTGGSKSFSAAVASCGQPIDFRRSSSTCPAESGRTAPLVAASSW